MQTLNKLKAEEREIQREIRELEAKLAQCRNNLAHLKGKIRREELMCSAMLYSAISGR